MTNVKCRFCKNELKNVFADLGMSPLSNSYLRKESLSQKEVFYPLKAYVCNNCFLVQLEEYERPDQIFSDYAYFSSYSQDWLKHCEKYAEKITKRLLLDEESQVVEIASNDGYLLQFFKKRGIKVIGVEPALNVAQVAKEKNIPTIVDFFGVDNAKKMKKEGVEADLLIANNVLAHVPNINDFVQGMGEILSHEGSITVEFPHLLNLIENNQFDTIYHEHFSYLSLLTVHKIFKAHGLDVYDVEEVKTHGGSLRIFAKCSQNTLIRIEASVENLLERERSVGLDRIATYEAFTEKMEKTKREILSFLIKAKNENKTVVGYGAPAKGNTLLNYCGIREDFLDYTVDISPHKQDCFLPGVHIPIFSPEKIRETKPDYIFILPWNWKEEIVEQMKFVREWGAKFVTPIPSVEIL